MDSDVLCLFIQCAHYRAPGGSFFIGLREDILVFVVDRSASSALGFQEEKMSRREDVGEEPGWNRVPKSKVRNRIQKA